MLWCGSLRHQAINLSHGPGDVLLASLFLDRLELLAPLAAGESAEAWCEGGYSR